MLVSCTIVRAVLAIVVAIPLMYFATVLAVHGGTLYPILLFPLIVIGAFAFAIKPRRHRAIKATDASDETGVCPNCDSVIALGAAECPVCKAVFGEGSAWEVQSRAAKDGAPYGEPRRPVQSDQPAATASGPQSGVMHRIIPIGIAVAVAPAPLLAFAVLNQSDDLALIASTALFNFTGPLGAVLVAIGILRRPLR